MGVTVYVSDVGCPRENFHQIWDIIISEELELDRKGAIPKPFTILVNILRVSLLVAGHAGENEVCTVMVATLRYW